MDRSVLVAATISVLINLQGGTNVNAMSQILALNKCLQNGVLSTRSAKARASRKPDLSATREITSCFRPPTQNTIQVTLEAGLCASDTGFPAIPNLSLMVAPEYWPFCVLRRNRFRLICKLQIALSSIHEAM